MRVTRTPLSPEEQDVVRAVIAVANLKRLPPGLLKAWDAVRRIMLRQMPNLYLYALEEEEERIAADVDVEFQEDWSAFEERMAIDEDKPKILQFVNAALRYYHEKLRHWIAEIARLGNGAYERIGADVERYLPRYAHPAPSREIEFQDGKVRSVLAFRGGVIPDLFVYGVALILDRDRGLADRLGQCKYCGRFNLTFEGRTRVYCSEAHRLAYDRQQMPERMWLSRARRKYSPRELVVQLEAYRMRKRLRKKTGKKGVESDEDTSARTR